MEMIEVTNLGDGTIMGFTQEPIKAVILAWLYANGKQPEDISTAPAITIGKYTVACGDWCTWKDPNYKKPMMGVQRSMSEPAW